jgi:hypothetical protein
MRLEERSRGLRTQLREPTRSAAYHAGSGENVRYTTFARQTGATPSGDVASASELWQRTAAAQERDVCLPRLIQNSSPVRFSTSDV